jgi:hypothetical protein
MDTSPLRCTSGLALRGKILSQIGTRRFDKAHFYPFPCANDMKHLNHKQTAKNSERQGTFALNIETRKAGKENSMVLTAEKLTQVRGIGGIGAEKILVELSKGVELADACSEAVYQKIEESGILDKTPEKDSTEKSAKSKASNKVTDRIIINTVKALIYTFKKTDDETVATTFVARNSKQYHAVLFKAKKAGYIVQIRRNRKLLSKYLHCYENKQFVNIYQYSHKSK